MNSMKIAIFGYGKMGKEIEKILIQRGHEVVEKITSKSDKNAIDPTNIDVVIEFSSPHAAAANIRYCIQHKLPVIIGTTGWYNQFDQLTKSCIDNNTAMVYGTNFSIGVNIFFTINSALAKIMNANLGYECTVKEVHHTEKKDAPSGTGITIAEDIIAEMNTYEKWENVNKAEISGPNVLSLASERLPDVPGTHIVSYENDIDRIDLIHTAKNRTGFALGSVMAAEWIKNKQGVFSIKEIMPELIKEII